MSKKYTASIEASERRKPKPKYTASVEATKNPSYSDKILGAVGGVIEKGGGSKKPLEEYIAESGGATDTALDGAYAAAQGLTYNLADEGYGAIRAGLDERPFAEAYPEHRDEAREGWAQARERSPFATGVFEVAGAMVSPANKILGAGKGLRGVLRGAADGGVQAYGATDREGFKDQAVDTAMGAGLGAGVGVVANAVTSGFSKSPNAVRAEVMGVKGRDYRVEGPGDRRNSIEKITKSWMLKNRKMEYDVDKLEFVPKGKSKFTIDDLEANTEERLLNRAEDAIEKIQQRKEAHFGKHLDNRFVSTQMLDDMVEDIANEYSKRGLFKGPAARDEAVLKIQQNMYDQIVNIGGDPTRISLRQVDQLKRMAQEDVRNFSKGLGELGDNDELARITARKLKNLVDDRVGDKMFKKLNSAQHDFLSAKGDLSAKLASLELATPASQNINKTSLLEGGIDRAFGGSQGRLDRAAAKEWYEDVIPKPVRAVVPYALEETPGVLYRQNMEGQQSMKGNWRNPSSVQNIPEELIRTPLPRTTQELMEKKDFVLMKVAQMMPEAFEGVKDAFENNPEDLGTLSQVIAQKMPQFFVKDKYNRFDGRIVTEQDKQKAIKDTMLRKDISAIEQGKIITKLNQEGIFEN